MELKHTPWPRLAPWLVLLVAAFAAGRWHASADRSHFPAPTAPASDVIEQIVTAAQSLPAAEAQVAPFFESLSAASAATVAARLLRLPASPARDPLFVRAMRRWGEFAAPAALASADGVENLPLRAEARAAVYEAWGRQDAVAAVAAATGETRDGDRGRALIALLGGAATRNAAGAVAHWEHTPASFRSSAAGDLALHRIAEAAVSVDQRAALQTCIAGLPPGAERAQLTAAFARQWGRYDPEATVVWLKSVAPPGASLDSLIDDVFAAFVRQDPVRAAAWATHQTDERRRSNYLAAAVAAWVTYDSAAAETWVNEQEDGSYLDGATAAIAAHFIELRHWPQAFAWTRRILRNEARAELLGNLGRIWHAEQPEEFATWLAQTSLNRAESEMLRSKIVEVASP